MSFPVFSNRSTSGEVENWIMVGSKRHVVLRYECMCAKGVWWAFIAISKGFVFAGLVGQIPSLSLSLRHQIHSICSCAVYWLGGVDIS